MKLPAFNLHQPATLVEALGLADSLGPEARFLAGGTDLLVKLKRGAAKTTELISLTHIPDLQQIQGLAIGGGVSLHSLLEHPGIRSRFRALGQAAATVASTQVRNRGTLAGNLCQDTRCLFFDRSEGLARVRPLCLKRGGQECLAVPGAKKCFAAYQGDTAAALLALGAEVRLERLGGSRRIALADLFSGAGDKPLTLAPGELLTHIILPQPRPGSRSGYRKFRLRGGIDFPLAGVALDLVPPGPETPQGELRVGLTGLSSRPLLLSLSGQASPDELAEAVHQAARPVDNVGGLARHRRHMARQMARDLLEELRSETTDRN